MTLLNKLEGLFVKVDTVEESYLKAMEQREQALLELQLELKDREATYRDVHKLAMLGQVSEKVYEAEKAKFEKLKQKVAEAHKELQLIQEYKTEDVHSILAELEAERGKYGKEKQSEIRAIQNELLEAKLAYLSKMAESKVKYDAIVSPQRKLDALKIKLGMKQTSYVSDAYEALNLVSVGDGGHISLLPERKELHDALAYGRKPEQLERFVKGNK
ncbi:hypothetical protein ACFQPF_12270 [Fictibacillus iocasae]|uniref:Phage shock protein A n=1 Tax=Fictibacillus iocasae TaxID=2715437 RepID=A0ABW2NRH6_9BACL